MVTLKGLLDSKERHIYSLAPESTAFEALELMASKNIGAVLVLKSNKIKGIFSERDYARKVILYGKSSKETPLKELMTRQVHTVTSDKTVRDCMALMSEKRIRHLPVVEERKLIGLVSIGDIVNALIMDQENTIKDLETYITQG